MTSLKPKQICRFINDRSLGYGRVVRLKDRQADGVWLVHLVDFPTESTETRAEAMFAHERYLQVIEDIPTAESYCLITVMEWNSGFGACQHRLAHVKTGETQEEVVANVGRYWFGVGGLAGTWEDEEDVYSFAEYPGITVECENCQTITLAEYVNFKHRGIPDVTHSE